MRSRDTAIIKLFAAAMMFYSCCDWSIAVPPRTTVETSNSTQNGSDPVANICQKLFYSVTNPTYEVEKGNETLKGDVDGWLLNHKWDKKEHDKICSIAKEVIAEMFHPRPMLCTQTVHNFMTKHEKLYYSVLYSCNIQDRWRDVYNCGMKDVFEKCIIKKIPATLRFLISQDYKENDQICKELSNLKKCAMEAGICRKLTDLFTMYEMYLVNKLRCVKSFTDLDPVAKLCQKIFDDYSSVNYHSEKQMKKLGVRFTEDVWTLDKTKKNQTQLCSTGKKKFWWIFYSPRVMLCTQRVYNFMSKHFLLYGRLILLCELPNRLSDLICGDTGVFEKCLGKKMLATLRYLNDTLNSDKCLMCKEAPNLKKCAKKAGLCRILRDFLYSYHRKEVAALQCEKCTRTSGPSTSGPSTSDKDTNVAAIVAGVAGLVVVGVLLSIGYTRFRRGKLAREFTFRETSTQIPASKTSFTASKKRNIPKKNSG